jgi:serine protease Do
MRRSAVCLASVLVAAVVAAADEPRGAADARKVEQALQAVIAKTEPAIACLLVYRADRLPKRSTRGSPVPDEVPDYYASGVVVGAGGFILTNYHVIRQAAGDGARPWVLARLPARSGVADDPPREGWATLFAADVKSDLAVLKLDAARGQLPTVPLGRGEDLKKGSLVVSLGHPYAAGFRDGSPSASWGIVSNLRRRPSDVPKESDRNKLPLDQFGTVIQTDVRLQLGTSGGALLDLDGKLVGLTTATAALTGVDAPGGFATPVDVAARRIIEVLLRGEEVEYGFLGITAGDRFERPAAGVTVGGVMDNSPARAAGLQPHDVIVKINGQDVRDFDALFYHLGTTLAGRRAELVVRRIGDERTMDALLVKAPIEFDPLRHRRTDEFGVATTQPPAVAGLRVEYTSVRARDSSAEIPRGVLVREATGPAADKNLVPYEDTITDVNGMAVNSPAAFQAAAAAVARRGDTLRLTVVRLMSDDHPPRTVTLP